MSTRVSFVDWTLVRGGVTPDRPTHYGQKYLKTHPLSKNKVLVLVFGDNWSSFVRLQDSTTVNKRIVVIW